MAGQVGSGYVDKTRSVSIWTRPDPPNVKIFRTRPDPRVDPTREQLCRGQPRVGFPEAAHLRRYPAGERAGMHGISRPLAEFTPSYGLGGALSAIALGFSIVLLFLIVNSSVCPGLTILTVSASFAVF